MELVYHWAEIPRLAQQYWRLKRVPNPKRPHDRYGAQPSRPDIESRPAESVGIALAPGRLGCRAGGGLMRGRRGLGSACNRILLCGRGGGGGRGPPEGHKDAERSP